MSATARYAASASRVPCRLSSSRATMQPARLFSAAAATNTTAQRWARHPTRSADSSAGSLLRRFQHSDVTTPADNAIESPSLHKEGVSEPMPEQDRRNPADMLAEWFPMLVDSPEEDELWKALDRLNPLKRMKKSQSDRDRAAADYKLFIKTSKAISRSFDKEQLQKLTGGSIRKGASHKDTILKHQRLLGLPKLRKEVYVRLLVVERFGFVDPLAEEKAKEANAEVVQIEKEVPLHVMQLAMSVHARAFGGLLRQHDVKVTSGRMSKAAKEKHAASNAMYSITLEGQKARLSPVVAWLEDVERMAQTLSEPLTDSISARVEDLQQAGLPSAIQLENIMRHSETLLTIGQEAPFTLSVLATDAKGVRKAQTMLAKQHIERLRRKERRVLALTAPALPRIRDAELPMYAMQMHLQPHVDDLQLSDDFEAPARLSRQDLSGNRTQVEYDADTAADKDMLSGTQRAVLQTVLSDGAQRLDDLRVCEKMLSDLQAQKQPETYVRGVAEQKTTRNMTVDFGHLLFLRSLSFPLDDKAPDDVTQLSSLLPARLLEGQWPVEHALGWLHSEMQKARRSDVVPQQAPMFVPALPPSATKIEAHMSQADSRPSSPFHSAFGSTDGFGSDKNTGSAHDRHDDVRAIIKEMLGAAGAPQSRLFRMLDGQSKFDEHLLLQYSNSTDIVQIKMKRAPSIPSASSNYDAESNTLDEQDESRSTLEVAEESDTDVEQSTANDEDAADERQEDIGDAEEEARLADEDDVDESDNGEDDDGAFYTGKSVWQIAGLEKIRSVQTDILVPDAPVDARLMANESTVFAAGEKTLLDESVEQGKAWKAFMRDLQPHQYSHFFDEERALSAQPPSTIQLDGRKYTLVDQHMKGQWTWNVVEDPELSPFPVQVHYALSHDVAQAKMNASLQMQWGMDGERGHDDATTAEEGEPRKRTIWQVIQRQIAPVLALPYSGGRGYDG